MIPNDPTSPWYIVDATLILLAWYFIGAFFINTPHLPAPRNLGHDH